jgi:hypothetical protein
MVMEKKDYVKPHLATAMTITYPNGAKQTVRPNRDFFKADTMHSWQELAKSIAGKWYLNNKGEIMNVPIELA